MFSLAKPLESINRQKSAVLNAIISENLDKAFISFED